MHNKLTRLQKAHLDKLAGCFCNSVCRLLSHVLALVASNKRAAPASTGCAADALAAGCQALVALYAWLRCCCVCQEQQQRRHDQQQSQHRRCCDAAVEEA
jgi:hypothetical protein